MPPSSDVATHRLQATSLHTVIWQIDANSFEVFHSLKLGPIYKWWHKQTSTSQRPIWNMTSFTMSSFINSAMPQVTRRQKLLCCLHCWRFARRFHVFSPCLMTCQPPAPLLPVCTCMKIYSCFLNSTEKKSSIAWLSLGEWFQTPSRWRSSSYQSQVPCQFTKRLTATMRFSRVTLGVICKFDVLLYSCVIIY